MDPRFQSPNNLYSSPENHSAPSKYPTLPPTQNSQYNQQYPLQQHFNPQYNPAGGPPGYIPPHTYGNTQILQVQSTNNESFLLSAKMRELESSLRTGFIKCYEIWLCLTIIGSFIVVPKTFMALIGGELSQYSNLIPTLFFYGLWSTIQSIFGFLSIRDKSLAKANITCWMMTLYLIPSLYAEIVVISWIHNYAPGPKDDTAAVWYFVMYTILFFISLHILLHGCVNMIGAFRVRKILIERVQIEGQLRRCEDSFTP